MRILSTLATSWCLDACCRLPAWEWYIWLGPTATGSIVNLSRASGFERKIISLHARTSKMRWIQPRASTKRRSNYAKNLENNLKLKTRGCSSHASRLESRARVTGTWQIDAQGHGTCVVNQREPYQIFAKSLALLLKITSSLNKAQIKNLGYPTDVALLE